ncbi:MAG: SPOR domain-containing protein [Candidatus Binatia bacterium]
MEKKAEKQSDSKPAPSADQQVKVFQEKSTSGQLPKEPVKEPEREPIKTEAKLGTGLKREVKSPPNADRQGTASQQESTQADEKTRAIPEKILFEQVALDPAKKPARGPIKTQAKPSAEPKTEVKAQLEEPRKMQGVPVSPAQTKQGMEEKISSRETARENNERLALAKNYGLDQGAAGYVIQIIFPQKAEAERWLGILNRQGYRVSMSSVGPEETVRLRVGAFPSPVQAKNHLQQLDKQGLKNGVVLQVIQ